MKINDKQLERLIKEEMNNLLSESQRLPSLAQIEKSWGDKNRAHTEKFNLENPRPAITKHGIRRQGDINNDMTDVILQGMKSLTGQDLKHGGEAFETEIRSILDQSPDVANKLHDIFMEIRTGGGFNDEWYEERHQDDQALGELDQALDQMENEDPEDWPDEDRA